MNMSITLKPSRLLDQMSQAAKAIFSTEAGWAKASGLPKETLSRLKTQPSCDLRTLGALAQAAGYTLVAVPTAMQEQDRVLENYDRGYENKLLDLAVS